MTGRPPSSGRFEDWRTPRAHGAAPDTAATQDFTAGGHGGYDRAPASPYVGPYAHPYAQSAGGQDPGTDSITSWADRDANDAQALLTTVPEATQRVLVYSNASGVRLAVATARPPAPLDRTRREILTAGFSLGMEGAEAPVSMVDTGSLGGWFGCGATGLGTTVCLAVDGGAVVAVSVTQVGQAAIDLARAARSAVEQRSS